MRYYEISESLDSVKHVLKSNWDLPDQVREYLESKNYKLIGSGSYSEVYESPSENMTIKVNRRMEGLFEKWYALCRKEKENPHLPKYGKVNIQKNEGGQEFYILPMEKLNPITGNQEWVHALSETLVFAGDKALYPEDWEDSPETNHDEIKSYLPDFVQKQYDDLLKTSIEIAKTLNWADLDYREDNFMFRGSNTIVITDVIF